MVIVFAITITVLFSFIGLKLYFIYGFQMFLNTFVVVVPLTANPAKWSNTLKQFLGFYRQIV